MSEERDLPLSGVRVLDLSRVLSGPFCSMVLADLGAEVIKVEPLDGDVTRSHPPFVGTESHYYISINRGKRSIAVNLHDERGLDIIRQLVPHSDVVLQNFRPGVLSNIGLDYETLVRANPALILCSISGFGFVTDERTPPAYDATIQALSGMMALNGAPDGPPIRIGVPMGDISAGIWAAMGVLAALQQRAQTGRGRHVEVNMIDSLMSLLGYIGEIYLVSGESPPRVGNLHHHVVPYGGFATKDGYIVIAPYSDRFWRQWCVACEREDLLADERFRSLVSRRENREVLQARAEETMRGRTSAEWVERFTLHDVPFAEVYSVGEALDHAKARGSLRPVAVSGAGSVDVFGSPMSFDGVSGPRQDARVSKLGEDTYEVLRDLLEMKDADIAVLLSEGVVLSPQSDPIQT